MSILKIIGFETWDLQELYGTGGSGTTSFVTSPTRTGNGAMSLVGDAVAVLLNSDPTTYADWTCSFGFRTPSSPSANGKMLAVNGNPSSPVERLGLFLTTGRQLNLTIPSGGTGSATLDVDTWYLIEVVVDSVANTVKIYIDGNSTPDIDYSGALAGDDCYGWDLRNNSASGITWYFDDLRLDDVAAQIGLRGILAMCPNGAGNDAWDSGDYLDIDDWITGAEDDTSTEVSLTAAPSTATSALESIATVGIDSTDTINAVMASGIIKRGGGGGGNSHHFRIRDDSPADNDSPDLGLGNQYAYTYWFFTGTLPDASDLDSWELGGRTSGSQNFVATAIALMIDFSPAAGGDQTVSPSSISSAESVESPTIIYDQTVTTNSITTVENFGTTSVVAGPITLTANSIASAEAFGTTVVLAGPVTLTTNSIASVETFGTTVVVAGSVTITVNSIASAEAIGSLTIGINISANSIPSAESVSSPQVNLKLEPNSIPSAEVLGNPTVTIPAGDQTVTANSVPSAEAFGTTTVLAGPVIVTINSIVSAEVVGNPTVTNAAILSPLSIVSAEAFGTQQVNLSVTVNSIISAEAFGTTIVTNAIIVSVSSIPSAEAIGSHQVNLVVTANSITSAETFGTVTIVFDQIVTTSSIPSAEAFGTLTITNATIVSPSSIPFSEAFGTTVVVAGVVVVQPNPISSAEAFGSATIVSIVQLQPTSIVSAEAVGNTTIVAGPVSIQVNGIQSAEAFGITQVIGAASIIAPGGIPSVEVFGSLAIGISVSVNSITSVELVESPTVSSANVIVANGISSAENIGNPTVALLNSIQPNAITAIEDTDLFDIGAGGFETDIGGWVPFGANLAAVSTDKVHSGSQSLKVTWVDTANGARVQLRESSDLITDLVVGKKYRMICWAAEGAGASLNIGIYSGATGLIISEVAGMTETMSEIVLDFICEHVVGDTIRFYNFGAGEVGYIDDITFYELQVNNPTVSNVNVIVANGIPSAESIGNPTIALLNTVQPNAVGTAEAVSSPTVNAYATVSPLAIPSEEDVVGPKLNLFVAVNGIVSVEAVGIPNIRGNDQTLVASSIASLEAFGLLTITPVSSKRWLIINNIITTLQGITTANGYLNTINFVSNQPIDYDEIEDAQIPFCIVDDVRFSDENLTNMVTQEIDDDLVIDVKAVFRASTGLSRKTNGLIKDIRQALYTDLSRGEYADITKIERITSRKTDKKNTVEINFRVVSEFAFDASTP